MLVLACDGLYDVMTNEKVGEYVREGLKEGQGEQELAESIVKHAIEKLFTRDNVTVIIVRVRKEGGGEGNDAHHAPAHKDHHHHHHHATHLEQAHHAHHVHHAHHEHQAVGGVGGGIVAEAIVAARSVPPPQVISSEEQVAEMVVEDSHDS